MQAPYPTVLLFAGYQVPTRYYQSLVLSLAQNGFAVIQVGNALASAEACKKASAQQKLQASENSNMCVVLSDFSLMLWTVQ